LEHAGIVYDTHRTTRKDEVLEYLANVAIDAYDSYVIVSGDGLVHEAVNAIMSRNDWRTMLDRVTLSHIPGGSGNGLASSVAHMSHEAFGAMGAAYLLCKGYSRRID